MASNEPAAYEPGAYERGAYEPAAYESAAYDPPLVPAYVPPYEPEREREPEPELRYESQAAGYGPGSSYVPAADRSSVYNFFGTGRGRHRVVKQRGGTMARSGAVLGVGVIAAVGAGGMAHAQERPAASISMPDLAQLPGVGSFFTGSAAGSVDSAAADVTAGATADATEMAESAAAAGEVLRARILEQADHQQGVAEAEAQAAQVKQAAETQKKAAEAAARSAEAAEKEREGERAQATAPEQQTAKQQAPKKQRSAPAARHSGSGTGAGSSTGTGTGTGMGTGTGTGTGISTGGFRLPLASYTLTAGFGQAGNMWSANHTGEDFAAPTGTPVKAVGGGTIVQAGWAGAYGYRIVLRLDNGTELWFCHLSSMVVTSGKVAPGQLIGRVGATGNVTGPHLHLEVRPGGGAPIDPLGWLRGKGLQP
ncbi:M23 family metallopeptidase [Streptomyces hiroshimensis]|uniref:Peptidase n=1 Tax=Streptomyces hiroshimensis TaxID=66424 RepID=A0ABQ2Z4V2_9ACTN|nr:M23 family metallopeptidase [Streptomyces hiroshimensis]GGY04526.1 peptidase [Streptomyces hiroshimensis]